MTKKKMLKKKKRRGARARTRVPRMEGGDYDYKTYWTTAGAVNNSVAVATSDGGEGYAAKDVSFEVTPSSSMFAYTATWLAGPGESTAIGNGRLRVVHSHSTDPTVMNRRRLHTSVCVIRLIPHSTNVRPTARPYRSRAHTSVKRLSLS